MSKSGKFDTGRSGSRPFPGSVALSVLAELVAARDYGRIITSLDAQQQQARTGGAEVLADVLSAAAEIAAACRVCQEQQSLCQTVMESSAAQEQQLHQQLQRLVAAAVAVQQGQGWEDVAAADDALSPDWRERLRQWWNRVQRAEPEPELVAEAAVTSHAVQPLLTVYTLGNFRVYINNIQVEKWPGAKAKLVFKYMVLHQAQPAHQEVLMEMLWPNADPDSARRSLYQAVYLLRQALQTAVSDNPIILTGDSTYQLHPEATVWVDRDAFVQAYTTGRRLEERENRDLAVHHYEQAENLYEGDLLTEDPYEEWLLLPREDLKLAYLDILDRLSRFYLWRQRYGQCVSCCRKILHHDQCREDIHRRLMRVYIQQEQRQLALRQYFRCERALQEELGIAPMPATRQMFESLTNEDHLTA